MLFEVVDLLAQDNRSHGHNDTALESPGTEYKRLLVDFHRFASLGAIFDRRLLLSIK